MTQANRPPLQISCPGTPQAIHEVGAPCQTLHQTNPSTRPTSVDAARRLPAESSSLSEVARSYSTVLLSLTRPLGELDLVVQSCHCRRLNMGGEMSMDGVNVLPERPTLGNPSGNRKQQKGGEGRIDPGRCAEESFVISNPAGSFYGAIQIWNLNL
jgi:hypothetical protein